MREGLVMSWPQDGGGRCNLSKQLLKDHSNLYLTLKFRKGIKQNESQNVVVMNW